MKTATLDEIAAQGAGFLSSLHAGDAVTILQDGRAVALLIGVTPGESVPRQLGCYAGQIHITADFNAPLAEFEESVEAPL
jgi:antitoxin (DNA-binding transcriptional repressor) of toxin-antitoxin stability system